MEELQRHRCHLSPGTLCRLLHGLERSGHLARGTRLVPGQVRKYYRTTPLDAQAALREARSRIAELVEEVLEDRGPSTPPEPSR